MRPLPNHLVPAEHAERPEQREQGERIAALPDESRSGSGEHVGGDGRHHETEQHQCGGGNEAPIARPHHTHHDDHAEYGEGGVDEPGEFGVEPAEHTDHLPGERGQCSQGGARDGEQAHLSGGARVVGLDLRVAAPCHQERGGASGAAQGWGEESPVEEWLQAVPAEQYGYHD